MMTLGLLILWVALLLGSVFALEWPPDLSGYQIRLIYKYQQSLVLVGLQRIRRTLIHMGGTKFVLIMNGIIWIQHTNTIAIRMESTHWLMMHTFLGIMR